MNSAKTKLLFIGLLLLCFKGFSQLSQTHYIPPLTSAQNNSASPLEQFIYISTPSTTNVSYTVMPAGQPSTSYITGTVSNTNPDEIALGSGVGQLFMPANATSRVVSNKGYIIEADAPIYVSVRMLAGSGSQAGALVSKGLSALGTTFRIGTNTSENPQDSLLDFISVMATEDNTQIDFSALPSSIVIDNYSGNVPFTINLNQGDSYIIATERVNNNVNAQALIGCLVNSNKPIVVNCGSANGTFGDGPARDYGIDQIVGLDKVGKDYIFVRGDGNDAWENVLIVAHTSNTTVRINGGSISSILNAGEHLVIEGDAFNNAGNMYVETNNPVFAYQGIGGQADSEANQGMFFVPPLSCETRGNIDNIATIEAIGNNTFEGGLSIVTTTNASVSINNSPLSSFRNTTGPNAVTGNSDYVTYKVTGLTGDISVQGDGELYVAYFNFNGAATSGSFYSGFPSSPEISFENQTVTFGNCVPVTLVAANAGAFDALEWLFDSGSGFNPVGTSPTFNAEQPGTYKLIGTITCTGELLESVEIPLPECPDDTDNDGIIDNIDIDNDNDGILNCDESRGNVTIDIANTALIFQDNSRNSTILNTNTFNGDASGNFTSTIPAGTTSPNTFRLEFNAPVNIKLSNNSNLPSTGASEAIFTAQISPSDQNITLVDPSNRLLVDSNFDGVFETGITQISGSEIRFKINPSPTGTLPYSFFAQHVEGIRFIHNVSAPTTTSTFNGNLSLTCFERDTDNDSISDEFDLDSDNDGLPDFIEHQGLFVPLSGQDSNLDGLDNIYDLNARSIDSDRDGTADVYDLDSDNDGVSDFYETSVFGGLLIDANEDGIEDGPYGTNGWSDAAETTPDSNTLNTTITLDPDNDTIFSYLDADSDGDACSDIIEANINTTGTPPFPRPAPNYSIAAPIVPFQLETAVPVCEFDDAIIALTFDPPFDASFSIQWEASSNGGVTFAPISDTANVFAGTQTPNLTIFNVDASFSANRYRAVVQRTGNSCDVTTPEIRLTINPLPQVNTSETLIQCEDDDGIAGITRFNLNEANSKISSNSANETFSFYLDPNAAALGDRTAPNFIANPTTFQNRTVNTDSVWVRIENTTTGCATTAQLRLAVASTAILDGIPLQNSAECDDFLDINGANNANNNDADGIAAFDFTATNDFIQNELDLIMPGLTPKYYRNEADALAEQNEITNITTYRNIGFPESQLIFVRIDSQTGNDCLGLKGLVQLDVNPLPRFEVDTTSQIVCESDDSVTVDLEPLEADPNEVFTYEWRRTNLDGTGLDTFISNERLITVSTPGIYTITLTKTDGTNCSRSRTITVDFSEAATLTPNAVSIRDLTTNNTVTIDTTNLGRGTYDYALLGENDTNPVYQDSPSFSNVAPGFYTILVRDIICGITTLDISVIGHFSFFTPNGDGINDRWQIKGIDGNTQASSTIHIFDRYGKLLKQLLANSNGWDGTANGQPLPTDDYWFSVTLEDGRAFTGHFTLKR